MSEAPWKMSFEEVMDPVPGGSLEEKMRELLVQLMTKRHWGPFEHPSITVGIEGMSRVAMAQITRHRLASFDIQSAREVDISGLEIDDFVWPDSFTAESVKSREGGLHQIDGTEEERRAIIEPVLKGAVEAYAQLTAMNIPKEDARYLMALAVPVNGTMSLNARSLMHIIALRILGDTQWEARDLSGQLLEIGKDWMPITFENFEDQFCGKRRLIAP